MLAGKVYYFEYRLKKKFIRFEWEYFSENLISFFCINFNFDYRLKKIFVFGYWLGKRIKFEHHRATLISDILHVFQGKLLML